MRLVFLFLLIFAGNSPAEELKIAAAANFTAPMRELVARFGASTGHESVVSYGSTGKLYTQIIHGAPYHLFLAADQEAPLRLQREGLGQTPHTYATGKLVLWSPDPDLIAGPDALRAAGVRRIAIANPKTAPYGGGALQIIKALGWGAEIQSKLVRGDNIAQTYQFVMTGNAQLGFVALSQVIDSHRGSRWTPPQTLYDPIHQDAILLNRGKEHPAAEAFLRFLLGPEGQTIARRYGYGVK
ncbi:MAG: molybdate ABC transporter substrate-binding protein [Gammaproteobacteria bacterium]|nr:molybdate ABC transporter substrate-binding protein [Gammaproteobacteria bacterium]